MTTSANTKCAAYITLDPKDTTAFGIDLFSMDHSIWQFSTFLFPPMNLNTKSLAWLKRQTISKPFMMSFTTRRTMTQGFHILRNLRCCIYKYRGEHPFTVIPAEKDLKIKDTILKAIPNEKVQVFLATKNLPIKLSLTNWNLL